MRFVCFFCQRPFYPLEERHGVRRATRPKGKPHRWAEIGAACDECAAVNVTSIEYGAPIPGEFSVYYQDGCASKIAGANMDKFAARVLAEVLSEEGYKGVVVAPSTGTQAMSEGAG